MTVDHKFDCDVLYFTGMFHLLFAWKSTALLSGGRSLLLSSVTQLTDSPWYARFRTHTLVSTSIGVQRGVPHHLVLSKCLCMLTHPQAAPVWIGLGKIIRLGKGLRVSMSEPCDHIYKSRREDWELLYDSEYLHSIQELSSKQPRQPRKETPLLSRSASWLFSCFWPICRGLRVAYCEINLSAGGLERLQL